MKFTEDELEQIELAIFESLDQFNTTGRGVLSLNVQDVDSVFTEDDLRVRQRIVRKIRRRR